jgi:ribonuclease HI
MFLFTDGASRGNPGYAGIGFSFFNGDQLILSGGYYIGKTTNNVAEMVAILVGLKKIYYQCPDHLKNKITIKSDSLLLMNQFNKKFSIKNEKLKLAHQLFIDNFGIYDFNFVHIPREENRLADSLANKGIDEKIILPENLYSPVSLLLL